MVDLDALDALPTPDTTLVSVMVANNEVGAVQPVAEVAERVRRRVPRAAVHADAVQAAAWLPLADRLADTDLVSLSSHKVGGLQGRRPDRAARHAARPSWPGRPGARLRSGTHDVAGIVGSPPPSGRSRRP